MSKYFDFVLCKHENSDRTYLFHAPAWSYLSKGDLVVVDTKKGEQMAMVISSITLGDDETDKIDFIMNATGADADVKKVLRKVVYREFEYKEDEANE